MEPYDAFKLNHEISRIMDLDIFKSCGDNDIQPYDIFGS
jgi:hypothetical protein